VGCFQQLVRRLGVLILVLAVFVIVMLIISNVFKQPPQQVLLTPTPGGPVPAQSPDVIDIPPSFENSPQYSAAPGTEVKGLGVVDKGFTFMGTDRAELVTGYLIQLPSSVEIAGFKLELIKPSTVLDLLVTGFKAIGVNDRQDLAVAAVGEEWKGVTFWTTWQGSKLRVDAVVFRKGNTGAVAAVVYPDGQKSSVAVGDIAKKLEAKIAPGK
jgi:hypothetical protein